MRRAVLTASVIIAVLGTLLAPARLADAATICAPVLFVGVRGSGEPAGFGATVQSVLDSYRRSTFTSTGVYGLVYPAAGVPLVNGNFDVAGFVQSVEQGSDNLVGYLTRQQARCPSQKIVMSGYSQGAAVIDYAIAKLPSSVSSRIRAIALLGDPEFDRRFAGNTGTFSGRHDGSIRTVARFTATNPYIASSVSARTRSYCLDRDPVCDYSVWNTTVCLWHIDQCVHRTYVAAAYTQQAGVFLASAIR